MNVKFYSIILVTTLAISSCKTAQTSSSSPQVTSSDKKINYVKHPYWIDMMSDPNANYFETVKAFEAFWGKRVQPSEEGEMGEGGEEEKERESKKALLEKDGINYRLECKRFRQWKRNVEPYVQPDGRILSAEEQLEIWKKQRQ